MKNTLIITNQRIKNFLILLILIVFNSCNEDDIVDEIPLDFLSSANAYSTASDAKLGITALHADVREWFASYTGWDYCMMADGTDLAFFGEDPASFVLLCNYATNLVPSDDMVSSYWDRIYTLIQKVNVLIKGIENIDNWTDDAERDAAIAEARFFRGFAYRSLVILFGDVPLITDPVDYAKTDFVRNPKAEVYAQIEADLTFAAGKLPTRGNEDDPGRITQGAAWHLLSEIYLAQSKFQEAVDAATHVINDYGYALMTQRFGAKLGNDIFSTGDVYFDLFTKENHNLAENTEGIWVIQIDPDITGGWDYAGERAFTCAYFRMGNTPDGFVAFRGEFYNGTYTGYSDTLGRGVAWHRPTNYLAYDIWRSDWDNDIRNAEHNIKRNFYFDNPESQYHGQKIDWSLYPSGTRNPLKDTNQYIYPYFMKVATPCDHYTNFDRSGGGYNHKDLYAFRLAETYLLRAEGYLGLENNVSAAADINMVRNRANATPVSAGDVTIDYILDERARELYTEEWRMLTLLRLGKLVERVRKYNNNPIYPGLNIQDHNNLWPIPQSQLDLNTQAKMEQNPGY